MSAIDEHGYGMDLCDMRDRSPLAANDHRHKGVLLSGLFPGWTLHL